MTGKKKVISSSPSLDSMSPFLQFSWPVSDLYWLEWNDQKRWTLSLALDNWTAIKVTSSPGWTCVKVEEERRLVRGWLVALIAGLKLSSMTLVASSRLICVNTPPYFKFHEGSREHFSAHLAEFVWWLG